MATASAADLTQLSPRPVWEFFAGLAATPRPSKNEDRIQAHVKQFCRDKGLTFRDDPAGNIVVQIPASKGKEKAATIVLQGHLDMVCEKNADVQIDFDNDPIRPVIDTEPGTGEQIVRAQGTTLGADNGIGVALAFALALDPDAVHGPLELLCTSDEETGMTGASALTADSFRGRILLNLDNEDDTGFCVGCAGGCDVTFDWRLPTKPAPDDCEVIRVAVNGLQGGHSGGDIHLPRGNALKILARVLTSAGEHKVQLAELVGGSKRNAIPREAHAVVVSCSGGLEALRQAAAQVEAEVRRDLNEPKARVVVDPAVSDAIRDIADPEPTHRLLATMAAVPSTVLAVIPGLADTVKTSNNLSTATSAHDDHTLHVEVGLLLRSPSADQRNAMKHHFQQLGWLGGADVTIGHEYPGWQPNFDSPVLERCKQTYRDVFGRDPEVLVTHGGLECGIIGERIGEIDMISIGPTIRGAHSPDERVYVASVERTYGYLKQLLADLAR